MSGIPKTVFAFLLILSAAFFAGCTSTADIDSSPAASAQSSISDTNEVLTFNPIVTGLRGASSVYVTPSREVFITETGRHRYLVTDTSGKRIDSLGSRGVGDYRFDRPVSIDATNGMRIFVADKNNRRVQVFDRRRQFLSSITAPDRPEIRRDYFEPSLLTVNTFSELFVYDDDSRSIFKYDQQGRFSQMISLRGYEVNFPITALKAHEDILYIGDPEIGVMHQIRTGGAYAGFTGGTGILRGISISDGTIWAVNDNELLRINFRGRVVGRYTHNIGNQISGVAASERSVFILTNDALHRAARP